MKEGWTTKKIGEIAKICLGLTHTPKYVENGVPFISVKDISSGRLSFKDTKYISREEFKEMPDGAKPQKGDLLFCRVGTIGKPQIIETDIEFGIFVSVGFLRIMDESLTKYTKYWMESPLFFRQVSDNVQGSTLKNLNTGWLKNFKINIPPRNEIDSITSRLDSAFAKIDAMKANAEKALNEAKALFQASLKEMLEPKEGWEEKTINDVAFFRNGIAHEKDIEEGGNYIVINSKFVATEGTIRKYTNEQLSPLYINEIVMVMSDVPKGKTLAKCYIIECDNKYSLNQRICAFKSKGLDVRFLYYMLNRNPNLLKYDNGENQTNLRKKQILDCPVSYPTQKDEQQSIVTTLDTLKSKVDKLQENYDKISQECDALKQAILRQVFE